MAEVPLIFGLLTSYNYMKKRESYSSFPGKSSSIPESLSSAPGSKEPDSGIIVMDLKTYSTRITIFCKGRIVYRDHIPLGGHLVTEDIRKFYSISFYEAECIKREFGCALKDEAKTGPPVIVESIENHKTVKIFKRDLAYIIQVRMEEIISETYNSIKASGIDRKSLSGGIIVSGGGALLPHLCQLIEYCTGFDAI